MSGQQTLVLGVWIALATVLPAELSAATGTADTPDELLPQPAGPAEEGLGKTPADPTEPVKPAEPEASEDRSEWLLGKVEPALEALTLTEGALDVIVYVEPEPATSPTPAEVKALHLPAIEALGAEIRAIERAYRPQQSLDEANERSYVESGRLQPTAVDRVRLDALRAELDARLDTMRSEIGEAARRLAERNLAAVEQHILAADGSVRHRIALTHALGATIPSWFLRELAEHPRVVLVVEDRPVEYELNVSVPSASYPTWWSDGFTGGVWDFGIVDSGVRENHPALSSFTFYSPGGSSVTGDHGTHVAGIVLSTNATYRGGAYGLDKVIWANSGNQSTTMSNMDWMATSAPAGPEAVNHSLGYGTASSDYNANDSFYDAYVETFDIMVTKSTGNGGWSNSSPTITHPAPAYNLLAVANMNDQNTTGRSDDVRRFDSSVGPTAGSRKKPDIAAPGTAIVSTNSDWATEPDFISKSGTSMAAPHVAAAIVLLQDGGNSSARAQKAVLINTADAWDSNNTSTTTDDGSVAGSQWDKSYGWGYLDMWEAHFNRGDVFTSSIVAKNNNATPDDYKLFQGQMFANEKATLVWDKRATTYVAGGPATGQHALSDIDLILFDESDGGLEAADADANDNVHQVAAATTVDAVLKVYAFSSSFAGTTSESFALATEENFSAAAPPSFSFNATEALPDALPGRQFTLTVEVTNNGDVASFNNTVDLTLPAGFSIVSGADPQNIGRIAGGASTDAVWTLNAACDTGGFTLDWTNSSNSYLETYTGSDSTGITLATVSLGTTPISAVDAPEIYDFSVLSFDWVSVAIDPMAVDRDLHADDLACVSSPYQSSTGGGSSRDFTMTNGHSHGSATHYALVDGAAAGYTIDYEDSFDVAAGGSVAQSFSGLEILEGFEVFLVSGSTYQVVVDPTSGATDYALFGFRSDRADGDRFNADQSADAFGPAVGEAAIFTAPATGPHGFVVVNEDGGASSFSFATAEIKGPPCDGAPIVLRYQRIDTALTLEECDAFETGPDFEVVAGGDLTLRSGTGIVLGEGFAVAASASFAGVIDPALNP